MAYTFPANGGLKHTYNGKTAGVFVTDSPLGPILVVGELVNNQWLGRTVIGPKTTAQWRSEISAAGGNVAFIRSLIDIIRRAVLQIFGAAPAPPPVGLADELNRVLSDNFKLDSNGFSEI